jgi:hypothetical protein
VHDDLDNNSHVVRSSMRDYINPDNAYGFVSTADVLYSFGGRRDEYLEFAHETIQFITEVRLKDKNFLRKQLLE